MSSYKNVSKNIYKKAIQKFEKTRSINLPHIATLLNKQPSTPEAIYGSVSMPIHLTSTYAQNSPGDPYNKFDYTRGGNPTVDCFEKMMANIEFGKYGIAFSSGMGAFTAILASLKTGDHVVTIDDLYGGTNRMLRRNFEPFGLTNTLIEMENLENLERAIQKNTKLIIVETPTNPTLRVVDIEKICELAKANGITTVVDNTFCSPILQSPLLLGADIVLHSGTKYIGGHSDLVLGAVVTNSEEWNERIRFNLMSLGPCLGPFEAYLAIRSLKTLKLRVEEQNFNTQVITEVIKNHPSITKTIYPGLKRHKNHDIALKQMRGPGAMLSFVLKGGIEETRNFTKNLKSITLAESLGGCKSLVNVPSLMTHMSVPYEERVKLGIDESLIRLSVGTEDVNDLLDDIIYSLDRI